MTRQAEKRTKPVPRAAAAYGWQLKMQTSSSPSYSSLWLGMALQLYFQKVADIENKKKISTKKLLLPLTSVVEISLQCIIFEF